MYLLVNIMGIFSIAKRINKKITIKKADDSDKSSNDQASFLTEAYNFDLPFFWKFTYIPRYIKYFNSFEAKQLPLVKSELYPYNNASELFKETHYKVYLRNKIIGKMNEIAFKIENNKKQYKVSKYWFIPKDINFYAPMYYANKGA